MEIDVELRDEAETMSCSCDCVICDEDLTVARGFREDRGVCVSCGFPYKLDPNTGELKDHIESIVYSSYDVSAREIECITEYQKCRGKPAPLWSYSPFHHTEFEEFSSWALENGFEEFTWVE